MSTTNNTFKTRRIFAAALFVTGAAFASGAVIVAPTASAEPPDPIAAKQAMVDACIAAAESISVPGHDVYAVVSGCCKAYGGQMTTDKDGNWECWFDPGTPYPGSPSRPGSPAAGHLPTDATHI